MPVTLSVEAYRSFGVQPANLRRNADYRLSRQEVSALLIASFLIWGNLLEGRRFENASQKSLVAEIERAISSNHAYDSDVANLRHERIDELAKTLETVPTLRRLFGDRLIYKSYLEDTFQAIRLSAIVRKSPLETVQALCEFDHQIYSGNNVALDQENIHYLVAIPRRRDYSYIYDDAEAGKLVVAEGRTSPVIMVGGSAQATSLYGGHLHVEGKVVKIDDLAGEVKRDAQVVVSHLWGKYSKAGYYFVASPDGKIQNPICEFLVTRDAQRQLAVYDALALGDMATFLRLPHEDSQRHAFVAKLLWLINQYGLVPSVLVEDAMKTNLGLGVIISVAADNSQLQVLSVGDPQASLGHAGNHGTSTQESQLVVIERDWVSEGEVFLQYIPPQEGTFTACIGEKLLVNSQALAAKFGSATVGRFLLPDLPEWLHGTVIACQYGLYQIAYTVPVSNDTNHYQGYAFPLGTTDLGQMRRDGEIVSVSS